MEKLQAMAEEKGKSSFGFAYYLDTCKEERDRGVTIQCNTKEFFTDKYHYTIVDAPGHKDYIKNMITGSATADVGLLLVPAEKGGFEAAIAKADAKLGVEEGQTRQHARLLYLLGVEQIIVGVNKMDACGWSEERFNEIKDEFVKMLQLIGFKPKKVPFIPYSGFNGDNLVEKSDKAPWYKGWKANINPKTVVEGFTLVEALNNFIQPPTRHPELPVRLPISNIYNIKGVGQIICGTVEQGTLKPGDEVGIVPTGLKNKKIFSIEQHKKQLPSAGPGDSVGLSIKGIAKDEKVQPGDIIYVQKEGDAQAHQDLHCHGRRPGAPRCPQARLLSGCLLPYRQGRLQDDQDPVEAVQEDGWTEGREPPGALPVRERRSRIRTEPASLCRAL